MDPSVPQAIKPWLEAVAWLKTCLKGLKAHTLKEADCREQSDKWKRLLYAAGKLSAQACVMLLELGVPKEYAEAVRSGMSASPQFALALSIPLQSLLGAFHGGILYADPGTLEPSALNLQLRKQLLEADLPTHLPALLTAVTTKVEAALLPASARPALSLQRIKRSSTPYSDQELPGPLLVRSSEAFQIGWHTLALFSCGEEFPTDAFEAIAQPTVSLGAAITRMCLRYLVQLAADAVKDRGFIAAMLIVTMEVFQEVAALICTFDQRLQAQQGKTSKQGLSSQPAQQADLFLQVMQSDGWSACTCISTVIAARSLLLAQDVSAHLQQQAYSSSCSASLGSSSSGGSSSGGGSSGGGSSSGGGHSSSGGGRSSSGAGGSAGDNLYSSARSGSNRSTSGSFASSSSSSGAGAHTRAPTNSAASVLAGRLAADRARSAAPMAASTLADVAWTLALAQHSEYHEARSLLLQSLGTTESAAALAAGAMYQRVRPVEWCSLIARMAHFATQGFKASKPLAQVWSAGEAQRIVAVSRRRDLLAAVLLNTINLCSTAVPYYTPLARTAVTTYRPINVPCTSAEVKEQVYQLLPPPDRQVVQDRLSSTLHIMTTVMPKLSSKQLAETSSNGPGATRPDPAGAAAASGAEDVPTGAQTSTSTDPASTGAAPGFSTTGEPRPSRPAVYFNQALIMFDAIEVMYGLSQPLSELLTSSWRAQQHMGPALGAAAAQASDSQRPASNNVSSSIRERLEGAKSVWQQQAPLLITTLELFVRQMLQQPSGPGQLPPFVCDHRALSALLAMCAADAALFAPCGILLHTVLADGTSSTNLDKLFCLLSSLLKTSSHLHPKQQHLARSVALTAASAAAAVLQAHLQQLPLEAQPEPLATSHQLIEGAPAQAAAGPQAVASQPAPRRTAASSKHRRRVVVCPSRGGVSTGIPWLGLFGRSFLLQDQYLVDQPPAAGPTEQPQSSAADPSGCPVSSLKAATSSMGLPSSGPQATEAGSAGSNSTAPVLGAFSSGASSTGATLCSSSSTTTNSSSASDVDFRHADEAVTDLLLVQSWLATTEAFLAAPGVSAAVAAAGGDSAALMHSVHAHNRLWQ